MEKNSTLKATISNYETGYRTPKQDDLFEIAHILNISIDDLFPTRNNKKTTSLPYTVNSRLQDKNVLNYANEQLDEQNKVTSIDEYKESKLVSYIACGATGAGIGEELYDDILHEEVFLKKTKRHQMLIFVF